MGKICDIRDTSCPLVVRVKHYGHYSRRFSVGLWRLTSTLFYWAFKHVPRLLHVPVCISKAFLVLKR